MSTIRFDAAMSRRVESAYTTPDVVEQRRVVVGALSLQPGERVLDIGSGPGFLACEMASAVGASGSVTGIDPSEHMLALAGERQAPAHVTFRPGNASDLPFADAEFDVVTSTQVYEYVADMPRALAEAHRVLRPGGRALIATWAPIDRRPMMKVGFDSLAEALPQLSPPAKGDLQQPEQCEREMTQGGFRDVAAQAFTASMHVASAEHYLRVLERAGGPIVVLKEKLGPEAWAQARVRILAAVSRRIPEGGADLAAEALLTVGVR